MRIFLTLALALLIAGCHSNKVRDDVNRPKVHMSQDGRIVSLIIDGEPVEFERCDTRENLCTAFTDVGTLVDQTSVTISVFQTKNPRCCYTFNQGGFLYNYCFRLSGSSCPKFN